MTPRIFVVDVFAERPYSGNQLAVVLSDEPLDVQRMQSLAAESNYSETTFVTPRRRGRRLRGSHLHSFPGDSLRGPSHPRDGVDHPTVRRHESSREPRSESRHRSGTCHLRGRLKGREIACFIAPPSIVGKIYSLELVASALRLNASDIDSGEVFEANGAREDPATGPDKRNPGWRHRDSHHTRRAGLSAVPVADRFSSCTRRHSSRARHRARAVR